MLNLEHFYSKSHQKINKRSSKPTDFHMYLRLKTSPLCLYLGKDKHFLICLRTQDDVALKSCKYRQMEVSISLHLPHTQQDTHTPHTHTPSVPFWRKLEMAFCLFIGFWLSSSLPVSNVFYSWAVYLNQCMPAVFPPLGPQCKWTWPMSNCLDGKVVT